MKVFLALALVTGLAAAGAAAPAPATVDAAARELPREHWQRAVTHARRLHDAVREEAATRDYADDQPTATSFEGSPARRRRVMRGAQLRRAPFSAEPDLRDAPNSGAAPAHAAPLPAAEPLPGLDAALAKAIKPVLPPSRPSDPTPDARSQAPAPLPTLDQAMAPLIEADHLGIAELSGTAPLSAITPGQTAAGASAACPAPRPGAALKGSPSGERAARQGCAAPRGI